MIMPISHVFPHGYATSRHEILSNTFIQTIIGSHQLNLELKLIKLHRPVIQEIKYIIKNIYSKAKVINKLDTRTCTWIIIKMIHCPYKL